VIKAVIFDMDGLLINSEPLWKRAALDIFKPLGVPLTYEMTDQTTGLRLDDIVEHWRSRYPWDSPSSQEVEDRVVKRLMQLVDESGSPMAGAESLIAMISGTGLPMAIASSSSTIIIQAVVRKLGIEDHMTEIHSAEEETHGKPHPGVYITAAKKLGVAPADCLTFEDSVNGVLAAKAARMKCVAVPDPRMRDDRRFAIADVVIDSLSDFSPDMFKQLDKQLVS
jgi:mannitol-1-/sugar-/sorbitol-6-/2-deoxyglucose-6-phosphatase